MDKLYYRHITSIVGVAIIVTAVFRGFDLFEPNEILLFCISLVVIIYSFIDFILEVKKEIPKKIILALDIIAIIILLFTLLSQDRFEEIDFKLYSEVGILISFGIAILTIGINNYKSYYKNILKIDNEKYKYKKKTLALNSKDAKLTIQELVKYEHNTVFNINEIIQKLKESDDEIQNSFKVHDGWGLFLDFYEYHVIKRDYPFYDYGINQLFSEFIKELWCANNIFSTLSNPQTSLEINKIIISNDTFPVHSFTVLRMEDSTDKYEEAFKHVNNALNIWKEIKFISNTKLEEIGAID